MLLANPSEVRIRCHFRAGTKVSFRRRFPHCFFTATFLADLSNIPGRRWSLEWGVSGGSLGSPGMSESPRQQTHWPWMRELQVLDDVLVSTMLRSLSTSSGNLQRPAVYASPLAFEWQPQAPTQPAQFQPLGH